MQISFLFAVFSYTKFFFILWLRQFCIAVASDWRNHLDFLYSAFDLHFPFVISAINVQSFCRFGIFFSLSSSVYDGTFANVSDFDRFFLFSINVKYFSLALKSERRASARFSTLHVCAFASQNESEKHFQIDKFLDKRQKISLSKQKSTM